MKITPRNYALKLATCGFFIGGCMSSSAFDVEIETLFQPTAFCDGAAVFPESVNIFETVFGSEFIWKANHETSGIDSLTFTLRPDLLAPATLGFSISKDLAITFGLNTTIDLFYIDGTGAETHWPTVSGPHINLPDEDFAVIALFATNDGIIAADPTNPVIGNLGPDEVLMSLRLTSVSTGTVYGFSETFTLLSPSEFDREIVPGGVTLEVPNGCVVPEPSSLMLGALGGMLLAFKRRR